MGINIPNGNQTQLNPKGVMIPAPTGGLSAIGLFGKLASGFINELAISRLGEEQDLNSQQTDSAVNKLVNQSGQQFSPDAIPNGKGGYEQSQSGFWDGTLSSVTNLPVMTALTFVGTTYTALNGQEVTIPDITFEMVMITIKKGRNIEKTEITGRDTGSVKEYISAKDFEVELRVIVTASQNVASGMQLYYQTGKYPEENMEAIDLLLNAPIAIKVTCLYLNKRGINYLVIEDGVSWGQVDGEYEAQRITIPCVSDTPLVLLVNT